MTIETDRAAIEAVFAGLERAWNHADGAVFAGYFDEDADFVNIYGLHERTRQKIADAHSMIFRTVYAGSTVNYTVTGARLLGDDLALAHVQARLKVPHGPLAGERGARASVVMRRSGATWSIMAFHNTLIQEPPGARP